MDESRILITGAYGQLGKALQAKYPNAVGLDHEHFDITDSEAVSGYDWSKVSVILNAAGFTDVDGAETAEGRERAWKINAGGPGYLSRVASANNLTLVHISTEYVFDGSKNPHPEDEPLTPLGVYAQTKAAGDIAVGTTPQYYIFRTSWLIGEGKNFIQTMMALASKNTPPTVVMDQIGRLTFTETLANAIDHLLKNKAEFGVYNVSNDGDPASWADVARAVLKHLGRDDLTVTDTSTREYFTNKPDAASRPLYSTFDLSKIKATGLLLPDWREELANYIKKEANR